MWVDCSLTASIFLSVWCEVLRAVFLGVAALQGPVRCARRVRTLCCSLQSDGTHVGVCCISRPCCVLPVVPVCMHLVCTMRAVCGPCAPALACHLHDIHHTSCLAAQWCSFAEQVSSLWSYYGSICGSVVWFRTSVCCTFGPFRNVGGHGFCIQFGA